MAATGFTPIQLYRTSTPSAVPVDTNLADGELAINTADEKLYFKNSAGTVKLLASNSGASGSVTSVAGTGTVNGITLTGTVTTSGNLTLGGALSGVSLTTQVTGTLPVANGGTGVTSSTGTGSVVLSNSPTFVTPILGTPTSGTLTNATGLPLTTGVTGTLPAANGGTGQTTAIFAGGLIQVSIVAALPGSPDANTLYIVTP